MASVKFNVPAISCNHCVHTIKSEVSELKGVLSVDASAATKDVVVTFDAPASEEQIVDLLKEINYPPAGK